MRQVVAPLLVLTLLGPIGVAWAQSAPTPTQARRASHSVASVLATAAYLPLKAGLCVIGGAATPLVFLSSGGAEAMDTVGSAVCKGTWVITPDILRGRQPLEFVREVPCCGEP